jgi:hypothetical protein
MSEFNQESYVSVTIEWVKESCEIIQEEIRRRRSKSYAELIDLLVARPEKKIFFGLITTQRGFTKEQAIDEIETWKCDHWCNASHIGSEFGKDAEALWVTWRAGYSAAGEMAGKMLTCINASENGKMLHLW